MGLNRIGSGRVLASLCAACVVASVVLLVPVVTAQAQSALLVTIIVDGQEWDYVSAQPTVGGILSEAGVALGAKGRVSCKLHAKPVRGMRIRVTRIVEKTVVQKEPIRFKTVTKFDPKVRGGKVVVQKGERGEKEIKYLVTYKDGVKVGYRVLEARLLKVPKDEIVSVSRQAILASRGRKTVRTLRMLATAYDPGPRSCGKWASGRTAIGMKAGHGVVAVDPRVIPLRTKLYVEGYGYCIAGDTGGAIKGNRIDLGFNTYREAIRFGRRWVTVHVLK